MPHYIKSLALALLIPFSTGAKAQDFPENFSYREKISGLANRARGYNIWDKRKPIDYTVANDSITYPIKINYTVDSIYHEGNFGTRADFKEAISLYYHRQNPEAFSHNMHGKLIHEALHYIQNEKIKHLRKRPDFKGLTFEQAYELEIWKEIASYVAGSIANKLASDSVMGLSDIVRMTNGAMQHYLDGQTDNSGYHNQYYGQALKNYNPKVTPEEGFESYLRCRAAIMTQYVNVNGKIYRFCMLPLLTDESYAKIRIPQHMLQKYHQHRGEIDRDKRNGNITDQMTSARQYNIMSERYEAHTNKKRKDPYPYSCRSDTLSIDVSDYIPKMTPAHFNQAQYMLLAIITNEQEGKHAENQEILAAFTRRRNTAIDPQVVQQLRERNRE